MDDLYVDEAEYTEFSDAAVRFGLINDTEIWSYNQVLDDVCTQALFQGEAAERMFMFSAIAIKLNDKAREIASRAQKALTVYISDINNADKNAS